MTLNFNDLWHDWLSKYEIQNEKLRLKEIFDDSDALFEMLCHLSENTVSQREIKPNKLSSIGNLIIDDKGTAIEFESRLERDFIAIMAMRRDVRVIDAQPIKIGYIDETGRTRTYTPDFHIVRRVYDNNSPSFLESIFVEVKFTSELEGPKSPDLMLKFRHAQQWAKRRGWRFAVFSENEIRTPELVRAEQLLPFRRNKQNVALETSIVSLLRTEGPRTIQYLQANIPNYPEGIVFGEVLRMLANRQIASDLASTVTEKSRVSSWQDFMRK